MRHALQSKCQILVKSAEANNSYSGLCQVTPKHFSYRFLWITSDTKDLKLKCFGVTSKSCCNYCMLW